MANVAIVTALQPRADLPAHPRASLAAGGLSLLERAVRQLCSLGATRIFVLLDDEFAVFTPVLDRISRTAGIELVSRALDLVSQLADEDNVLMLEEGVLLDDRLIAAVAQDHAPHVIAVFPSLVPEHGKATRIDPEYAFASVFKAGGTLVRDVCRGLGDWDLVQTALRAVVSQPDVVLLPVNSFETYMADQRRPVPILWQPMRLAADEPPATDRLLDLAENDGQSWPGRYFYRPLENALLRAVLPAGITPGLAGGLTLALGTAAVAAFASGWLWLGLALMLLFGLATGVARKLGHLLASSRRAGDFLSATGHGVALSAYAALAWHFHETREIPNAFAFFFILSGFSLAESMQAAFFRRLTGRALDDSGVIERRLRLFMGERNSFFWALLPFAGLDAWAGGYKFIAAYAFITFFLAQFRFFVRAKEFGVASSPRIAANFERTDYGTLRRRKPGTR